MLAWEWMLNKVTHLLIINMSLASDLSTHHDHSSLCHCLAGNLAHKHKESVGFGPRLLGPRLFGPRLLGPRLLRPRLLRPRSLRPRLFIGCDNLPLRQDPAWDGRPGLRQTLGRTSCLWIFYLSSVTFFRIFILATFIISGGCLLWRCCYLLN